jgi:glutamate-1-semialdehyde 2,1-aminomutase
VSRAGPGPRSRALFRRAERILVGGVDSPVRSFGGVGGTPIFFERGRGPYLYDVDDRRYLDLVSSWGANLWGNAAPRIVRAVQRAAADGLTFGAPSAAEHELGEAIRRAARTIERIRFVNSGTEATMSAIRVARGTTGRPKIVKFAGGYHGHSDGLLARAGSGVATHALPESAGVPGSIVAETLVAPYNDVDAAAVLFEKHGPSIAAVIVEPVAGNMGVVLPRPGFLRGVTRLCRSHGALLIADEVITGFRLRRGLIHPTLGATADLVTLGKIIGGGLPVGAYGGRAELMEQVAPLGPVYQAGTLSGNPLAMRAGLAALEGLDSARYRHLERMGRQLEALVTSAARDEGLDNLRVNRIGSMLGCFFAPAEVTDFASAQRADRAAYARWFHAALRGGVYLPPSALETTFVSLALRESTLAAAALAFRAAARAVAAGGH